MYRKSHRRESTVPQNTFVQWFWTIECPSILISNTMLVQYYLTTVIYYIFKSMLCTVVVTNFCILRVTIQNRRPNKIKTTNITCIITCTAQESNIIIIDGNPVRVNTVRRHTRQSRSGLNFRYVRSSLTRSNRFGLWCGHVMVNRMGFFLFFRRTSCVRVLLFDVLIKTTVCAQNEAVSQS